MGNNLKIKQAESPDLIKWENLGVTNAEQWVWAIVMYLAAFLFMVLHLVIQTKIEDYKREADEFLRSGIDCDLYPEMYPTLQEELEASGNGGAWDPHLECTCRRIHGKLGDGIKDQALLALMPSWPYAF